jgi:hypothetical protein
LIIFLEFMNIILVPSEDFSNALGPIAQIILSQIF